MKWLSVLRLGKNDTLYLDMSNGFCKRNNHSIYDHSILLDFEDGAMRLFEGRYCVSCGRVYVDRNYYAGCIHPHGTPLVNTEFVLQNGEIWKENELSVPEHIQVYPERSDQSLLNKRGYNVGQTDDLPDWKRQRILKDIIDSGELSKGYICSHLKYLIKINGKIEANWLALQKWQRDLEYVQSLDQIMTLEDLLALNSDDDDELPF